MPLKVLPHGGGARADLLGLYGYLRDVEDMAAFLVPVGSGVHSELLIAEAHRLNVYPVAVRPLALQTSDNRQ